MSAWTKIARNARMASPKVKARQRKKPKPAKSQCIVYCLMGPDEEVRYVGQTRAELKTRLDFHKRSAFTTGTSPCAKWIRENGGNITIAALDSNATWNVSEILWIDRFRRAGHHLWNVTRGGDDTISDVRRENCFPATHKAAQIERMKDKAVALGIEPVQAYPQSPAINRGNELSG